MIYLLSGRSVAEWRSSFDTLVDCTTSHRGGAGHEGEQRTRQHFAETKEINERNTSSKINKIRKSEESTFTGSWSGWLSQFYQRVEWYHFEKINQKWKINAENTRVARALHQRSMTKNGKCRAQMWYSASCLQSSRNSLEFSAFLFRNFIFVLFRVILSSGPEPCLCLTARIVPATVHYL